jgi:hypothetical protein
LNAIIHNRDPGSDLFDYRKWRKNMTRSFECGYFDEDALRKFAENVFVKLGVSEEHSKIAADVLIEADLRGFDSH